MEQSRNEATLTRLATPLPRAYVAPFIRPAASSDVPATDLHSCNGTQRRSAFRSLLAAGARAARRFSGPGVAVRLDKVAWFRP